MRVKVRCQKFNTQRLLPIKRLLTDDIISENWHTRGLPTGNIMRHLATNWHTFIIPPCTNAFTFTPQYFP